MTKPKTPRPKRKDDADHSPRQESGAAAAPTPLWSTATPLSPEQQKELERKLAEQFADGEDVESDSDDLLHNVFTDEERLASKKDKGQS